MWKCFTVLHRLPWTPWRFFPFECFSNLILSIGGDFKTNWIMVSENRPQSLQNRGISPPSKTGPITFQTCHPFLSHSRAPSLTLVPCGIESSQAMGLSWPPLDCGAGFGAQIRVRVLSHSESKLTKMNALVGQFRPFSLETSASKRSGLWATQRPEVLKSIQCSRDRDCPSGEGKARACSEAVRGGPPAHSDSDTGGRAAAEQVGNFCVSQTECPADYFPSWERLLFCTASDFVFSVQWNGFWSGSLVAWGRRGQKLSWVLGLGNLTPNPERDKCGSLPYQILYC